MTYSAPIVWLSLLISLFSQLAQAQAYCALRDPARHIQALYPDSTQFRSIVKTVDESTRQHVASHLPPNALHFGELGRHTLYVALRNQHVLGLVHVRAEESRWGLVEIAWSIDLNLHIQDFSFQRCRNRARQLLESHAVKRQFQGKGFTQLKTFLAPDGHSANRQQLQVPDKAVELAGVVVRNGLKTLLVTAQVWAPEIEALQMLSHARDAFPSAASIQLDARTSQHPATAVALKRAFGNASLGTDRSQIKAARVLDHHGHTLGVIYRGIHQIHGQPHELWWAIRPDLKIQTVISPQRWPSKQVKQAFSQLTGKTFATSEHCGTQTELMALETIITARPLLAPPATGRQTL